MLTSGETVFFMFSGGIEGDQGMKLVKGIDGTICVTIVFGINWRWSKISADVITKYCINSEKKHPKVYCNNLSANFTKWSNTLKQKTPVNLDVTDLLLLLLFMQTT